MTGAHVFNVPQPYRAKEETVEKPRSRFRWFGHVARLGSNKHTTASQSTSHRTHSSYISSDHDIYSPVNSPRGATSKSLTSEADLTLNDTNSSLLKLGLLRRHHNNNSADSLRSSIASTTSTSTTLSDDLSPPSSTTSLSSSSASTPPPSNNDLDSPRIADATWRDDAHVIHHYARLHWRVVRIQADGNCLFRAVSDQIYRNEAFYGDIRRRVVEYIEREREMFQPFVENEQTGQFEPIDAYCTRMKQDGQWGGNPELYAVARLFNVHIVVHQGPLRTLRIENGSVDAPELEIHLLFRNDHYDSLHDEAQLDEKPRLSTSVAAELEADVAAARGLTATLNNQIEDAVLNTDKKKKKKCVVFIGEQTRVERVEVELPQVVVHAPVRFFLRRGKVCALEETNQLQEEELFQEEEEEEASQASEIVAESEACLVKEPESPPLMEEPKQESELSVARVNRVSFRRGRRVAA